MTTLTGVPRGLKTADWLGFTPATDPVLAASRFTERYGQPPAHAIHVPNTLLVGPVPAVLPAPPRQLALEVDG